MIERRARNTGFSLLEVAIVLLILAALLGSVMRPFGANLVQRQRQQTMQQLLDIREAIIGFAAARHRLPCPAQISSAEEGDCSQSSGFVPAVTLGISGPYDENDRLVDVWNNPLRYSVSLSDSDADGLPDFTTALQMRHVGMQFLDPDMEVCADAGCGRYRANRVPLVLLSTGQNGISTQSEDEAENIDGDLIFVSADPDMAGDNRFDDLTIWLSGNILYSRMLQAGVLP